MQRDRQVELACFAEVALGLIERGELRTAGGEGHGDEPVVRREMLLADARHVFKIARQVADRKPFAVGVAVGVNRADAGVAQTLDRHVGVIGRIVVVRPINQCRDAGIERFERAEIVGHIHIVGRVEFAHDAADAAEILSKAPVRRGIAQQTLPRVAVGIHETRDNDAAAAIDFARIDGPKVRFDGRDLVAVDQDVRVQMLSDLGIHGDDDGIANDRAVHRTLPFTSF